MDDQLQEKDLIQVDGTIENLINQIKDLNTAMISLSNVIKKNASATATALRSVSGATKAGRTEIEGSINAADRYAKAQRELGFAMSETGKQVAWLKAQTSDVNKATVEQQRQMQAAASSYDRLKADIKEMTALYKSLSKAEREDSDFGGQIIADLHQKTIELKALNAELKPHIEKMTRLQKAQEELAYWQSKEGQETIKVRKEISRLTATRKEHAQEMTKAEKLAKRLSHANSTLGKEEEDLNYQLKRQTALNRAHAKEINSTAGSYDYMAARYVQLKIALKSLNLETDEGQKALAELRQEALGMNKAMRQIQESTGNFSMNVGNYKSAFTGLGFQVQQVVRELPSAAVSLNTFFLAISNNIPMLVDEIQATAAANKVLKEQGEKTTPVIKQIGKALFSWQSLLVIGLTLLPMYGKQLFQLIGNFFKGTKSLYDLAAAMRDVRAEIIKSGSDFGSTLVTFKKFQEAWKGLATEDQKKSFVEKYKTELENLKVGINDVKSAENAFVQNTSKVEEALKARAKAAAAYKLAAKKYEEMFQKQLEREQAMEKGPSFGSHIGAAFASTTGVAGSLNNTYVSPKQTHEAKLQALEAQRLKLQKEADTLFQLGYSLDPTLPGGDHTGKTHTVETLKDLSKFIERTRLELTKKTNDAVSKQELSDARKRRKDLTGEYAEDIMALQNREAEIDRILTNAFGKYKNVTEKQKEQLRELKTMIASTLGEVSKAYNVLESQLSNIELSESLERQITGVGLKQSAVASGSNADYEFSKQTIELERQKALTDNLILVEDERQSEVDINAKYDRMLEVLAQDHEVKMREIRIEGIEAEMQTVREGSDRYYELQKQLLEQQYQLELQKNSFLPAEQQKSPEVIGLSYGRKGNALDAEHTMSKMRDTHAVSEAQAWDLNPKRQAQLSLANAKEEWNKQIELAKSGMLDWSKEQIAIAEATVAQIDEEIRNVSGFQGFARGVGEKGLMGGVLESLGFKDDSIDALTAAKDYVISALSEIAAAEVEAAQAGVEAAKERAEAVQGALNIELQARANGYANNVETLQAELAEEKKKQREKEKLLKEAQKRQEAINSITQASSLVTASAQLWSSLSGVPIVGPALAVAAIGTMWGSFIASKIKATQLTQQYGEGGLEFLEGGSHASGHDIDLGVNNRKNRRMKVEGGEALAVINKAKTQRYRKVLPDVIESFNKGTFEEKYLNAFAAADPIIMAQTAQNQPQLDLSKLESDVREIRDNAAVRYYTDPDGTTVIIKRGYKRVIRKS